jgi:hypothetical protein
MWYYLHSWNAGSFSQKSAPSAIIRYAAGDKPEFVEKFPQQFC